MNKAKKSFLQRLGSFIGYMLVIAIALLAVSVLVLAVVGAWYFITRIATDTYRLMF